MSRLFGTQIHLVGANHNTTPVEIREKLAISNDRISDALKLLGKYASQGIIVSTCNRTEIYTLSDSSTSQPGLEFLKSWTNSSEADLLPYLYCYQNEDAVRHLFNVAAGLDSMIIGEFEILGQIRQSLERAKKARLADYLLQNLFQQAIRVGRRVRTETGISRNALSVSSVAVELAARAIDDLSTSKALVIGTGEAGRLVAKVLKERGVSQIATTSRSYKKASALAATLNGSSVRIENLSLELATCDIVISCTSAPHLILHRKTVENAMQVRPTKPLVIIDIAVPRDVDPKVKQVTNVFLYDIDDFAHLTELNRKQREAEIQNATEIVKAELEKFTTWWRSMEVKPIIRSLTGKAEGIRRAQLNKTLKKLRRLSTEEQESLEAMTKAIVQKILHSPIQSLKNNVHRRGDYIDLVSELFQLTKDESAQ